MVAPGSSSFLTISRMNFLLGVAAASQNNPFPEIRDNLLSSLNGSFWRILNGKDSSLKVVGSNPVAGKNLFFKVCDKIYLIPLSSEMRQQNRML